MLVDNESELLNAGWILTQYDQDEFPNLRVKHYTKPISDGLAIELTFEYTIDKHGNQVSLSDSYVELNAAVLLINSMEKVNALIALLSDDEEEVQHGYISPEVIKFQNELATPLYAYVYSAEAEATVKRAYIAGKVTGLDMEEVRNKFACAEMEVRFCGYDVVNPVTGTNHLPDGTKWQTYMRITMCLMMTCDVVIALPDCDLSTGARAEIETAISLGIPVISYNDLINQKKRRTTHATA